MLDGLSTGLGTYRVRFAAGLRGYAGKVRLFRRNARLYLGYTVLAGAALGIFRLLFNFYVLSIGYDEALLGRLLTVSSLTALVAALPAGYASDRYGRRVALLLSCVGTCLAICGMVVWPSVGGLLVMNVVLGLAQSLGMVTLGPYLMENSGPEERTYLFSFAFGMQMMAGFGGNWLGGLLPAHLGAALGAGATTTLAYGATLAVVANLVVLSAVPVILMRPVGPAGRLAADRESPFAYARRHPVLLGKLLAPMLVTSLGAGLLIPFMNLFYRQTHRSPDATIGTLFALGSLAMAVGLLAAPPLADRYGKMQTIVVTQALSIPFLALLGFAPWFYLSGLAYLVRQALMNMSNPVYQNFVMEQVDERARASVASLVSMCWNFGWAFSPTVSGQIQVAYGFGPVFLLTMSSYLVAIAMLWRFFGRAGTPAVRTAAP